MPGRSRSRRTTSYGFKLDLRGGFVAVVGDVDGHALIAQSFGDPVGVARHVLDHKDPHLVVAAGCGIAAAKGDLDAEPAFCTGVEHEAAAVRGGDGGDDREPEPVAVVRSGPVLAEACERLGELRNGGLVEHRAAGVDGQSRLLSVQGCECELDRAARLVVVHGVLDHVLNHASEQRGAAHDLDSGEMRLDGQPLGGDLVGASGERDRDQRLERDLVVLVELAVLGAGEREEALQQPVGVVEIHAQLRVQLTSLSRHAAGLRDRDVEGGAHHRQRGAQIMRGVCDEPSLRVKRRLQAIQQPVDRIGEQAQLIARTSHRETLA